MLKKKAQSHAAAQRLGKVAAKKSLALKSSKSEFLGNLAKVSAQQQTVAASQGTTRLVEQVRSARQASFLDQFRRAA